jgi:hypothetical protein
VSLTSTSTLQAPMPPRTTSRRTSRIGSTPTASTADCRTSSGTPTSTSAPSSMSPLMPAEQSSQPINGRRVVDDVRAARDRAAKTPALKPLSMFTTVMPGAQAFSIASSAASPPKLAP